MWLTAPPSQAGPAQTAGGYSAAAGGPQSVGNTAPAQRAAPLPGPTGYSRPNVCERCGTQNQFGVPSCVNCGLPIQNLTIDGVPHTISRLGNPAGFWIRFLAALIDTVILSVIGSIVWPLLFGDSFWVEQVSEFEGSDGEIITFTTWTIQPWYYLMWAAYSIAFHAVRGATPGKMLLKIRVYDNSGREGIGWLRATVRMLATWVSSFTLLIGYIMAGVRKDKRALHDLIAGTYPTRPWNR